MQCNHGHTVKVIDGPCGECARDRQAAQRTRNRIAREFYTALMDRNIPMDADHLAEGHRLLTALNLAGDIRIG